MFSCQFRDIFQSNCRATALLVARREPNVSAFAWNQPEDCKKGKTNGWCVHEIMVQ